MKQIEKSVSIPVPNSFKVSISRVMPCCTSGYSVCYYVRLWYLENLSEPTILHTKMLSVKSLNWLSDAGFVRLRAANRLIP